jgi:UDP-2-acetamido-3-amino-2,3-dideoxy-glucuronate N-acetyltransferase
MNYFKHESAYVDEGAVIGAGTKIWHFSHIMKGAVIGERCIFGQNVNIADGVAIGNNVKVQNNVSIYTGTIVEDDVFLGPSCVLTNVTNPRSQINRHSLYEKTVIKRGASLGANCTIVCGVTIGRYALIAAGAVVTRDVTDYALVMGCPARQTAWVSRHGHILKNPDDNGVMICPESGLRYQPIATSASQSSNSYSPEFLQPNKRTILNVDTFVLRCLDLDEESPLPIALATGHKVYDDYKKAEDL